MQKYSSPTLGVLCAASKHQIFVLEHSCWRVSAFAKVGLCIKLQLLVYGMIDSTQVHQYKTQLSDTEKLHSQYEVVLCAWSSCHFHVHMQLVEHTTVLVLSQWYALITVTTGYNKQHVCAFVHAGALWLSILTVCCMLWQICIIKLQMKQPNVTTCITCLWGIVG